MQRRAISVVGRSTWNGLPLVLRAIPTAPSSPFYQLPTVYNMYNCTLYIYMYMYRISIPYNYVGLYRIIMNSPLSCLGRERF